MKDMKVNAIMHQKVYIDPADAFDALKQHLGLSENSREFLCERDGQLMRGEDVSYHGSPVYEYTPISNNPKWLELYRSMKCLDDYFKHSDEPEWNRMIEHEESMDEINEPVQKM